GGVDLAHGRQLSRHPAGARGPDRRGPSCRAPGGGTHHPVRHPPPVRVTAAGWLWRPGAGASPEGERRTARGGLSVDRAPSLFAGVEPLEVFVELLSEVDTEITSTEFYDRICEAICRLTTMRRPAIFMADAGRRRVRAVGSHGTSFEQLATLE